MPPPDTLVSNEDTLSPAQLQALNDQLAAGQVAAPPTHSLLLTNGFTLPNVKQLLGQSINQPDVMGWFIVLGPNDTAPPRKIRDIEIMEMKIDTSGSQLSATMQKIAQARPRPVTHYQRAVVTPYSHDVTYPAALGITQPQMFPNQDLTVADLSHYRDWAEASFVRRSDLEFLQIYLDRALDNCDDVFFSGSFVNYGMMHNPRLRVQQHNLPSANGTVPDSGKAFTIKLEPFVRQPGPGPHPGPLPTGNAGTTDNAETTNVSDATGASDDQDQSALEAQSGSTANGTSNSERGTTEETRQANSNGSKPHGNQSPPAPLPLAFSALPCPDFWEVHAVTMQAAHDGAPGEPMTNIIELAAEINRRGLASMIGGSGSGRVSVQRIVQPSLPLRIVSFFSSLLRDVQKRYALRQ